jgi:hypothetical protein
VQLRGKSKIKNTVIESKEGKTFIDDDEIADRWQTIYCRVIQCDITSVKCLTSSRLSVVLICDKYELYKLTQLSHHFMLVMN